MLTVTANYQGRVYTFMTSDDGQGFIHDDHGIFRQIYNDSGYNNRRQMRTAIRRNIAILTDSYDLENQEYELPAGARVSYQWNLGW